ncbi:hypothetical protein JAAARDRAFT_483339 [Jaapia argillacea MUCL 33604]|uniref:Uncharacterized protein n=1 Tax=Jaapia argillacea MUCL 33604 TaxID=933084 RepID=A0A067PM96_9AGAM|nr:hypothetical protein JAAARDRAFT_483339 [Jaapia argillacea MUCL 33604]
MKLSRWANLPPTSRSLLLWSSTSPFNFSISTSIRRTLAVKSSLASKASFNFLPFVLAFASEFRRSTLSLSISGSCSLIELDVVEGAVQSLTTSFRPSKRCIMAIMWMRGRKSLYLPIHSCNSGIIYLPSPYSPSVADRCGTSGVHQVFSCLSPSLQSIITMNPSNNRKPYHGERRKLVFAFDVGTTFSGISYSILDPGEVPKIWTVTMYPGQGTTGGDSKVASILEYDANGSVCAIGAEASQYSENGVAEERGWTKVEWFKLHLRPKTFGPSRIEDGRIPPLPGNKSVVDVFADFFSYLYRCGREHIQNTHAAGDHILRSVEGHIEFILGHPNGWGGAQQAQMRQAAIKAALVPDNELGHARIQFVTEGEASLHYCLNSGLSMDVLKEGANIMVVDCGGGTIDLSSFRFLSANPIAATEIAPPGCRLQGSVFVNRRAYTFLLEEKLKGSSFDDPQDVERIVDRFETIKRRFKEGNGPVYIRFGTSRDDDPEFGVKKGVLKLTEDEVAGLFRPSLDSIVEAIDEQIRLAPYDIQGVFMVGGFTSNDWLFSTLRNRITSRGLSLCRPDGFTNKAVADGALSFYLDHFVSARVARMAYGSPCNALYDSSDTEHVSRASQIYVDYAGYDRLRHGFSLILPKGTRVQEEQEFRCRLCRTDRRLSRLKNVSAAIMSYIGAKNDPKWTDLEPGDFETLCTVTADTSQLLPTMSRRHGPRGHAYYR